MSEDPSHISPNNSLATIEQNESDECDGSFEVLEDESPVPDMKNLEGDYFEPNSDQLSGSCLCVDNTQCSESICLDETQQYSSSSLMDHFIATRSRAILESPQHLHEKRIKVIDNQSTNRSSNKLITVDLWPLVSHRLCVIAVVCLIALFFALVLCNLQNSYQLSQLREEIVLQKIHHTQELSRLSSMYSSYESRMETVTAELERERLLLHELRLQSEQRLNREVQSENAVVELQHERDKLINELRARSELYATQKEESNKLIVELQAERHRLMDAIERTQCPTERDRKKPPPRDWLMKKLRKMKESFETLRNRVPGIRHLKNIFCRNHNWCDEL